MKYYRKPVLKEEIVSGINEPIYMACSGKSFFEVSVDDYQHQHYEDGRDDARFQVNGTYSGPYRTNQDVYLYIELSDAFDLDITKSNMWKFTSVAYTDHNTKIVAVTGKVDVLNLSAEGIGIGDYVVVFTDESLTSSTPVKAWMSFGGPGSCL